MQVKLKPNQAMQDCLAELVQGRKILHIVCEPSQMDILKIKGQKTKNLHQPKVAILCITNGKTYSSIKEAAIELNLAPGAISRCINGFQHATKDYKFERI